MNIIDKLAIGMIMEVTEILGELRTSELLLIITLERMSRMVTISETGIIQPKLT